MVRLGLHASPRATLKAMLRALTTLDSGHVLARMRPDDIGFFTRLLRTTRSGEGFLNDLEHRVDELHTIRAPPFTIYSPYDKSVPPSNAQRVSREVVGSELYETPADTHLIWIGPHAAHVWHRRRAFLQAHLAGTL